MDIVINGPGEVVVCFIDRRGKVLMQERSRISGSSDVSARRPVNLSLETRDWHVDVSPVLISQGGKQRVRFDGQEAATFTMTRCKEIGCSEAVLGVVGHGRVELLPTRPGHTPTQRQDDQDFATALAKIAKRRSPGASKKARSSRGLTKRRSKRAQA
jgi:hypothetical protein